MKPTDFAIHLSRYLGVYLPGQSGCSVNTVRSYRDTFSLFLRFCQNERKLNPQKLTLEQVTRRLVEDFLQWLETERGCSAGTRNNRLAAIHAFYKYLQFEAPHLLAHCQEILSIPNKRAEKKVVSYLTLDEIQAILALPDPQTAAGCRDLAMLALLYDTGTRVQELADLKFEDVRLSCPTVIRLTGKGGKARFVPIMAPTEKLLRAYLEECDRRFSMHGGAPSLPKQGREKTYPCRNCLYSEQICEICSTDGFYSGANGRFSPCFTSQQSHASAAIRRELDLHPRSARSCGCEYNRNLCPRR